MTADPHAAATGNPIAGDADSFPSDAEYARTLLAGAKRGTLSTLTAEGFPFGSVVSYVLDDDGSPVLCISALAEHTMNARRDPRASILVAEPVDADADPLAAARVTLVGNLALLDPVPEALRQRYVDTHPGAAFYVSFPDFSWWRLEPVSVRYVGGFGHMSWADLDGYRRASADPIAGAAPGICAHMNEDHADANLAYARVLAGIADATAARMVGVDRYGLTLEVESPRGGRTARIAFDAPPSDADEVRHAVIALLARARAAG